MSVGSIESIANQFECSTRTVERIWARAKSAESCLEVAEAIQNQKKENVGRKRKTPEDLQERLLAIPQEDRSTLRDTAASLEITLTSLWREVKRGEVRKESVYMRPTLTNLNKIQRLKFATSFVDPDTLDFDNMKQYIHVDKKWLYLKPVKRKAYLAKNEKAERLHGQSRRYVTKIMFLADMVRPEFRPDGSVACDGMIGLWAFVKKVPAQRNSKNRPKGTIETHPLKVTKPVYRAYILSKVISAIRAEWPRFRSRTIDL